MTRTACVVIGACLLVVAGCETTRSSATSTTRPPHLAESTDDFRVFVGNQCPMTDLEGEGLSTAEGDPTATLLGAVLIPKIVESVVDAGASYLQKRIDNLTTSYSARGSEDFFASVVGNVKPRHWLNCISLARGQFGEGRAEEEGGWDEAKLKELVLRTAPSLYVDLHIAYSEDETAFQVRPVLVEFRKASTKRVKWGKEVLITGHFEAPYVTEEEAVSRRFGAFQIRLPKMREGTILRRADLRGVGSQWIPMPGVPSAKFDDNGTERTIYGKLPFTVFVTVQETEKAGDLLLEAVDVADASKGEVSKVLADALVKQLTVGDAGSTDEESKNGGQEDH